MGKNSAVLWYNYGIFDEGGTRFWVSRFDSTYTFVKSDDHYINFTTHFRVQTRENKGQTKLPFSQSQDKDNNKESLARQSHIKNCQIAAVAAKVRRWCDGAQDRWN